MDAGGIALYRLAQRRPAGRTRESEGTLRLEPGRYVAFCHAKSPDDVVHFGKGTMKLVTVRPAAPAALVPTADIVVTLRDYSFTFSRPLTRRTAATEITIP